MFRAFFNPFWCHWNRELLSQTEGRMMHFVTLTVPPAHTNHSLMHNSTRGMSPGQKGFYVRFRENVRFGPFSWVIAHDFQHSGQFYCNILDVHRLLIEDILWGFHWFLDSRVQVSRFFCPFMCLCNQELLAQNKAIMMHFDTLTVPPPRTDHSLMHNSTRDSLRARRVWRCVFAKTSVSGHFRGL
jgi:hypothetical protein